MTDADARIAALAGSLFYEQGITATGVDALSRAAGISKRTLYERFGSKDGLIAAAYGALDVPTFEHITGPAERASDEPRGQLDGLFAHLESAAGMHGFRGCPFANAAAELADGEHPALEVVRGHKERIRRWILLRAKAAGAAGPERLSRQLMLLLDGAQTEAVIQGSAKPVKEARLLARTLVDEAVRARHERRAGA